MSVRKKCVERRRTLIRCCDTCGRTFSTSAESPWIRQVPKMEEGKRQATVYYCSEGCKQASYKHLFDGKADERKRARDAQRDRREYRQFLYQRNAEQERAYQRERYWSDPGKHRADQAYQRKKRKLMAIDGGIWT